MVPELAGGRLKPAIHAGAAPTAKFSYLDLNNPIVKAAPAVAKPARRIYS